MTLRLTQSRVLAWTLGIAMTGMILGIASVPAGADDFSGLVGPPLFEIPRRPGANGTGRLTLRAIESLPEVVRGERSALIVATTDEGNLAKLLVSPALRRRAGEGNPPEPGVVPILSIDRFETIDRGDRIARKARGRDVVLFDGFSFDLDTGQVVPAGFGGDIAYSSNGKDGPELVAIGRNTLHAIDRLPALPGSEPGRPSSGRAVIPTDFNGRYTLIANGQISGALELAVAPDGSVTGGFRSDRNGNLYPVTGKLAPDLSRRIAFEVQFPRSRQSFDGLLWTEEKNVFAGTVKILDHPYSFIAIREGSPLYPEPIDATSPPRAPLGLKATTRVVTMEADHYGLDGVPKSGDELAVSLAAAVKVASPTEVLIRVPPSTPFEKVERAVRIARSAGIGTIRLGAVETP